MDDHGREEIIKLLDENSALRKERDDIAAELTRVNKICNVLRADLAAAAELLEKWKYDWDNDNFYNDSVPVETGAFLARMGVK